MTNIMREMMVQKHNRKSMKLPLLMTAALITAALLFGGCIKSYPVTVEIPIREPLTQLPADLAAVTFTIEGKTTAPYIMLELSQPNGFNGFAVVNGDGKPVWYFRTVGGASGFTRRQNGNFVFLDAQSGLVEITLNLDTVHILPQEAAPGRHIHHDVTATPSNTLLFIADDWQMWKDSLVNGGALWEWIPENGTTLKRWSSFDHLNPDSDKGTRSITSDWLHLNSVTFGPWGNIVLSSHFLDQVLSITPDFKNYEWRFGGIHATIPVSDPFSGQHCVQEIQPGHLLLFDNGYERTTERYSRGLELELVGNTSHKVWEWRPPKDNWSRVIGSARRLPNGNTMLCFGFPSNAVLGSTGPIEVYEVKNGGEVVWHLIATGGVGSMYRATPLCDF